MSYYAPYFQPNSCTWQDDDSSDSGVEEKGAGTKKLPFPAPSIVPVSRTSPVDNPVTFSGVYEYVDGGLGTLTVSNGLYYRDGCDGQFESDHTVLCLDENCTVLFNVWYYTVPGETVCSVSVSFGHVGDAAPANANPYSSPAVPGAEWTVGGTTFLLSDHEGPVPVTVTSQHVVDVNLEGWVPVPVVVSAGPGSGYNEAVVVDTTTKVVPGTRMCRVFGDEYSVTEVPPGRTVTDRSDRGRTVNLSSDELWASRSPVISQQPLVGVPVQVLVSNLHFQRTNDVPVADSVDVVNFTDVYGVPVRITQSSESGPFSSRCDYGQLSELENVENVVLRRSRQFGHIFRGVIYYTSD